MICKKGHAFSETLACPTCASESSTRMLLEFAERAIRNGERVYRHCDHITVSPDWWRRFLDKQGISKGEGVPALCGASVPLADLAKAIRMGTEQDAGKCRRCEARVGELRT